MGELVGTNRLKELQEVTDLSPAVMELLFKENGPFFKVSVNEIFEATTFLGMEIKKFIEMIYMRWVYRKQAARQGNVSLIDEQGMLSEYKRFGVLFEKTLERALESDKAGNIAAESMFKKQERINRIAPALKHDIELLIVIQRRFIESVIPNVSVKTEG